MCWVSNPSANTQLYLVTLRNTHSLTCSLFNLFINWLHSSENKFVNIYWGRDVCVEQMKLSNGWFLKYCIWSVCASWRTAWTYFSIFAHAAHVWIRSGLHSDQMCTFFVRYMIKLDAFYCYWRNDSNKKENVKQPNSTILIET